MTDDPTGELDAFFASYRESYTDLDLEAVLEHYNVPLLSVTDEELYWLTTPAELESMMGAYLDTLAEGGYDRGEIDALSYHPLSERDVIASSAWTRYTTDGDVFERLGTTYLCRRTEQGWRIVALVLHDPETAITG